MARCALWCAAAALPAAPAVTAWADDASYTAMVNADHVHVRGGPGTNYFATEILRRGERVEVYGRDADGWCRVRPPAGSFSWVPADALTLSGGATARVTRDRVEACVGSRFDDRRDTIQVLLNRDEVVEVLPGQQSAGKEAAPAWYKIAPPSGEFRWIHEHYLRPEDETGEVERRTARRSDDKAIDNGRHVKLVGYDADRNELGPRDEPRLLGDVGPTRSVRRAAAEERGPGAATLDELEIEVAEIAAGTAAAGNLAALEDEVRDAARQAQTTSERRRADILARRVESLAARGQSGALGTRSRGIFPEALAPSQPADRLTLMNYVGSSDSALASRSVEPASPAAAQTPQPSGLLALAQYLSPSTTVPAVASCQAPGVVAPILPAYPAPLAAPPPAYAAAPYFSPYGPPPTRHYLSLDALGWWVKHDQVPALVTTSPTGTPQNMAGVLGLPTTSTLFGDQSVNGGIRPGGRVQGGIWVDPYQTFAVEGGYYALATASTVYSASSVFSNGPSTDPILARPFFNDAPGVNHQSSILVAFPNLSLPPFVINMDGSIQVRESSNIQSANAGGRYALNPYTSPARFFLTGAYRFFNLAETLGVTTSSNPGQVLFVAGRVDTFDNFATTNVFNGGEVGLGADLGVNRLSLIADTRLAMGNMHETLAIDGRTSAISGGYVASYAGGLLAQPTNIGNYSRDRFALIPQVDLKLGYQILPALRLTVGYNFTYITRVVRPGEQVNTTVNTTQVAGGMLIGPAQPSAPFSDSGLWLQGVTAGLDFRF